MDKFNLCRKCGSQLCYTHIFGDIESNNCLNCGFHTNSEMKKDSETFKQIYEGLPELYKDVCYTDNEDFVWIPTVINYPSQGMVFLDGTSKDDWKWTAIKATLIPEEDRFKFPIPNSDKFYEYKMDMSTQQHFNQEEFMGALIYIGAIKTTQE